MKSIHELTLGMTLLSAIILFVAFIIQAPTNQSANAQEATRTDTTNKSTKMSKNAIPILLADGYKIKSLQYLDNAMIFLLQRGSVAFVCETDHNGISKICVQLQ